MLCFTSGRSEPDDFARWQACARPTFELARPRGRTRRRRSLKLLAKLGELLAQLGQLGTESGHFGGELRQAVVFGPDEEGGGLGGRGGRAGGERGHIDGTGQEMRITRLLGAGQTRQFDDEGLRLARGEDGTGKPMSCTQAELRRIAEAQPSTLSELDRVASLGPQKLDRFGPAFLAVLREG